ncbi:MAG: hypothetical protein Kow0062_21340 [Acidobacteriota bacterium]
MTTTTVTRSLGRYTLESRLGAGGMAEVFRATDTVLGRTVAIKIVRAGAASVDELRRFRREARLLAGLDHPGIVPVWDFGEDDGASYFVMPYLGGGTLADRLAEGAVDPATAVAWIAQIADALDAAHAVGVLHRDVKPRNILLDERGAARLADFGLARALGATRLTAAGLMVGTPLYLAPEIALGCPAEPASDRYALAVTAFELLAGRPPFHGDEPGEVINQHVHATPPPLPAWIGPARTALDAVFERALAKRPEDRHVSCAVMARALREALEAGPERSEPVRSGAAAPPAPRRRRRAALGLVVLAAVVAAGTLLLAAL